MKKSIHTIFLAVIAGSLVFASCQKEITTPAENPAVQTGNTTHREGKGYTNISLGVDASGTSTVNMNDDLTSPTGGFQTIIYNGTALDYMTGITRLVNSTDALLGLTGAVSSKPGSLFLIDVNNGFQATDLGNTRMGSSTGPIVYLQDIEAVNSGSLFYAIEEGTTNIYVSVIPQGGGFPLIWNLAATVSTATVSSALHGLDIYNGYVYFYGNGTHLTASNPGTSGYYGRYQITTFSTGALSQLFLDPANCSYAVSAGEDAAFMVSDDANYTGAFVMFATPSLSSDTYYNDPVTTNFTSSVAGVQSQLVDYTFFPN